jgi:hypothetical protein
MIKKITAETNVYAKEKIANKTVPHFSIWHEWYDVVEEEMLAFLAFIINMGVIHLPYVKDYWSQQFVCRVPFFFGEVFTRKRFLQIFWMLHLETVSTSDHSLRTRTQKASNFLKYIDARLREHFIPGQNLSVDESVVGFKGKISFITYNPKNQLNGESMSMFWETLPPTMSAPSSPTMAKSPQRASSNQTFLLHPKFFLNFSIISDRHGLTPAVTTFLLTDFIQAQHLPVN